MRQAIFTGASISLPNINKGATPESLRHVNHTLPYFMKPFGAEDHPEWSNSVRECSFRTLRGTTNMKTIFAKAALVGTAIATLGMGATEANAASATATARAKILRQVTVTNSTDLQFGTIVTGATASTVVVSTAGVRTCGAGLVCSGATTAAAFAVGGTTGSVVTISVPATVTLNSGANSMTATLNSSAATATLVANAAAFTVGGVLAVGASQADGDYAGTFSATVDYQ